MAHFPSPEIETLAGRAASARYQLESLVAVLGDDHMDLRADGDAWDVRGHLAHVAAVDLVMAELLVAVGAHPLDLEPHFQRREEYRLGVLGPHRVPWPEAQENRDRVLRQLVNLEPHAAGSELVLPPSGPWGTQHTMQLRSYLADWAVHDLHHDAAIREAVRGRLSPAALAATAAFSAGR